MNDRRNDEDLAVPRQRSEEGDVLEPRDAEARAQEAWVEEGGAWVAPAAPQEAQPAPQEAHAAPQEGGPLRESKATGGAEQLRERWRDVQSSFVDEPREAVARADGLVDEVVTTLTTELRHRWKDPAQPDTEQLRLALRDYRQVFERLLTNEVI